MWLAAPTPAMQGQVTPCQGPVLRDVLGHPTRNRRRLLPPHPGKSDSRPAVIPTSDRACLSHQSSCSPGAGALFWGEHHVPERPSLAPDQTATLGRMSE